MPNLLYHVTGPSFCAGFVVTPDGLVIKAAPILHVWTGRRLEDVMGWIDRSTPGKYHLRLVGPDPNPLGEATYVVFTSRQRGPAREVPRQPAARAGG
jgi:hypothetical protein